MGRGVWRHVRYRVRSLAIRYSLRPDVLVTRRGIYIPNFEQAYRPVCYIQPCNKIIYRRILCTSWHAVTGTQDSGYIRLLMNTKNIIHKHKMIKYTYNQHFCTCDVTHLSSASLARPMREAKEPMKLRKPSRRGFLRVMSSLAFSIPPDSSNDTLRWICQ